jgi:phosphoribosylformimino-5-aminoimidazole carboxamide ribotide isomerase
MIILPAIDLKDGKCVRLRKGEFETAHQVADSAVETAATFAASGAKWIHMVDLDGARNGMRQNSATVAQVAKTSGLRVELGGGMRSMADLEAADAMGVTRMVIGSAAVSDPQFVAQAVERYGSRIAVGIDCLEGRVRTAGWEQDSGLDGVDFAKQMEQIGVKYIIYTDIATDGMLSGPTFDQLERLSKAVSCSIVASGGVTTLEDVKNLQSMGLYGAIIGKAYYAGTIDLAAALTVAGEQG